jgi:hypothetical protein
VSEHLASVFGVGNEGTAMSRDEAIMHILTAFETAAHQRVNTPFLETRAEGVIALTTLGVTTDEIVAAWKAMGE